MDNSIDLMEFHLRHLCDSIKYEGRIALKDFDITDNQFLALQWIDEYHPVTIGKLAELMEFPVSTTSELIEILVKKELTAKVRDTHDKRKMLLTIEPCGKAVIDAVIKRRQQYLKGLINESNVMGDEPVFKAIEQLYDKSKKVE